MHRFKVSQLIKEVELRFNPVTIMVNKFDEDSAKKFMSDMDAAHQTGQPVIPVCIDSYGGQVYSLMTMMDCIRSSERPVATIAVGKAMSCGAFLLSCGTDGKRYAAPNSTIMIHEVSGGAFGKVDDLVVRSEEITRLNEKLMRKLAVNCGKDENFFIEKIHDKNHADLYVEPDTAKEWNLVNHVRIPTLTTDISVNFKFE